MRNAIVGVILVFSFATGANCLAQYRCTGDVGGKHFDFKASAASIAQSPIWDPNAPNPPLSPRRALEIARKQLGKLIPGGEHWLLDRISLADTGDGRHWIYLVTFIRNYPENVAVTFGDNLQIPVLLDGRPVEPTLSVSQIPPR